LPQPDLRIYYTNGEAFKDSESIAPAESEYWLILPLPRE
jgi:hypothetical protein